MRLLILKFRKVFSRKLIKGQVALPTIVLLGSIMLEVIMAGALVIFLFNNSAYGSRLSVEALSAASSGIQDALIRLAIDKNFVTAGYTLPVGQRASAFIIVERNPIDLGVGKTRIKSLGTSLTRNRKIEAVININILTGAMKIEAMSEVVL